MEAESASRPPRGAAPTQPVPASPAIGEADSEVIFQRFVTEAAEVVASQPAEALPAEFVTQLSENLMAALDIHGQPQPADVFRVVDLVVQHPNLESVVLQVTRELVLLMGPQPNLHDGLSSRRLQSPACDRVINELMDLIWFDSLVPDDEIDGFDADLHQQHDALGSEIQAWVRLGGKPIESVHAFNEEDNAPSFARLLARLRGREPQGTSTPPEQTAAQVSFVIQAIANNAAMRSQVFSLAEHALGSCGDNLAEGFSKILLAVDNHRMAQAVESGEVNAKQLNDWAGSLFRLSLLESAVHRFIHTQLQRSDLPTLERNALTNEPLETMVHAKVDLRQRLDLPNSTTSAMRYRRCSVLTQDQLGMLALKVEAQANDGQERDKFLLNHQTWRAGMKALHAQEFTDLKVRQDDDPFFDLDVPRDLDGQAEYAAQALRVQAKYADEENALLLHLAANSEVMFQRFLAEEATAVVASQPAEAMPVAPPIDVLIAAMSRLRAGRQHGAPESVADTARALRLDAGQLATYVTDGGNLQTNPQVQQWLQTLPPDELDALLRFHDNG